MADKQQERLTIQQVSSILYVSVEQLKEWEKVFSDFFRIRLKINIRKRYNQDHIETFNKIKELLQIEKYTVEGAKRRLELDRTLTSALGVEQNFQSTVFFMFSAIMEEMQKTREESRNLAKQVELLRTENSRMEERLVEEQNKSIIEFIRSKLSRVETG